MKALSGCEREPNCFYHDHSQESNEPRVFEVFGEPTFSEDGMKELDMHHKNPVMAHLQTELTKGTQAIQDFRDGKRLDLLEVCAPWDSPGLCVIWEGEHIP